MLNVLDFVNIEKAKLKARIDEVATVIGKRPRLALMTDNRNIDLNTPFIVNKTKFAREVGFDVGVIHIDDLDSLKDGFGFWGYNAVSIQYPFFDLSFDEYQNLVSDIVPSSLDADGIGECAFCEPTVPLGIKSYIDYLRESGIITKPSVSVNIIGYGNFIGKPLSRLLLADKDYSVSITRSSTDEWIADNFQMSADVIVCATPQPNLIKCVNRNKVYIDCGYSVIDGELVGNISKNTYSDDVLVTPVPNGVELLSTLSLLKNAFECFERYAHRLGKA